MTTEGFTPAFDPACELQQLRDEVALLRAQRQQLLEQQAQHTRTIEDLQQRLQYLLRRLFGRSAEKVDPQQMLLFESLLNQLAPPAPAEAPALPTQEPRPTKGHHGRGRLPANLPRQKVIHDLPEADKPCPCCGRMRHVIGQEVSEELDYVPAKLTVIAHVRLKYACRSCEQQAAEGGPQIVTAAKPPAPIKKGLAAPGLLAYVIVSKYTDHLPLHRLERILARHGVQITRSTMCSWVAQCAGVLRPLYDFMGQEVRKSRVIHTDDTPVDVLDRARTQTRRGHFWVYLGDEEHPYTVYTYTPSRSRDGPRAFLKDWGCDRPVFLQADAFSGYDGIYYGEAGGQVTEVACWAHARRKFYEARTSDAAHSTAALAHIRLLYDVEDQAAAQFARECASGSNSAVLDPAAAHRLRVSLRHAARQQMAVPRLVQFRTWLDAVQACHGGSILPKSPMGEAITYTLNQWEALCVYTTDGVLSIDNNASENALRRIAVGRKNWLFCGSDEGGHTAAVLFSLLATCQRRQVEPLAYLRDVLTRIAAHPADRLAELLPGATPTS